MSIQAELKRARVELNDMTEVRDRLHKENKSLEATNDRLNKIRLNMYESLMIEREELSSRIRKIDLRIQSLGIPPDSLPVSEMRYKFDESVRKWTRANQ